MYKFDEFDLGTQSEDIFDNEVDDPIMRLKREEEEDLRKERLSKMDEQEKKALRMQERTLEIVSQDESQADSLQKEAEQWKKDAEEKFRMETVTGDIILQDLPDIQSFATIDIYKPLFELGGNLPINYYDNDDGFWTDYIKQKRERWYEDNPMIVGCYPVIGGAVRSRPTPGLQNS